MDYDVAAGMDNATLNTLVDEVYRALYPKLLTGSVDVDRVGFSSVAFDINQAPTVELAPAAHVAYFEAALATDEYGPTAALPPADKAALLELAVASSFDLILPSVALTINYSSGATPTTVTAAVTAAATVQCVNEGGQGFLTPALVTAQIGIAADPDLAAILNGAFAPLLVDYLNNHVLAPVRIPTLQYKSLLVSMPVPVVAAPYVTAYAALGATPPDIPAPQSWPTNCVYVAVDAAALQAAADTVFPLGPSESFSWEVISGEVSAQVLGPSSVIVNANGSVTATLVANASAQLTLHTPWWLPNVSFGPSATATLTATLLPSVNAGELELSIEGVPIPSFSFDWGIPGWINWFFEPLEYGLAVALNAVLQPLMAAALTFPPIPVLSLPVISFSFEGATIEINIDDATTSSSGGLLLIQAQAGLG